MRSIGQVAVGKQQQNGIGAALSAAAAKLAAAASGRACAPVHSHVVEARDGQPALVALQEELRGVEATAQHELALQPLLRAKGQPRHAGFNPQPYSQSCRAPRNMQHKQQLPCLASEVGPTCSFQRM